MKHEIVLDYTSAPGGGVRAALNLTADTCCVFGSRSPLQSEWKTLPNHRSLSGVSVPSGCSTKKDTHAGPCENV